MEYHYPGDWHVNFLNHLQFGDPESSLSDGDRKIIYFDSEKLIDRNFNRVVEFAEQNFFMQKFFENFIFKAAERNKRFG